MENTVNAAAKLNPPGSVRCKLCLWCQSLKAKAIRIIDTGAPKTNCSPEKARVFSELPVVKKLYTDSPARATKIKRPLIKRKNQGGARGCPNARRKRRLKLTLTLERTGIKEFYRHQILLKLITSSYKRQSWCQELTSRKMPKQLLLIQKNAVSLQIMWFELGGYQWQQRA